MKVDWKRYISNQIPKEEATWESTGITSLGFFYLSSIIIALENEIQAKHLIFDSYNPLSDAILKEYLQSTDFTNSFEKLGPKGINILRKDWKSLKGKINRKLLQIELFLRGFDTLENK